jgi:hypothetical protein
MSRNAELDADMMAFVAEKFGIEFAQSIDSDYRHGVEIYSPRQFGTGNGYGTSKPKVSSKPSEAQMAFIASLLKQKGVERDLSELDKAKASKLIGELKALPNATVSRPAADKLEPGKYIKDGVVYEVAISGKGYPYAKELVIENGHSSFEYAPGAVRNLTAHDKLTLEQAEAYGHEHGVCCLCGRELTNPDSIERGIGPVCASKF